MRLQWPRLAGLLAGGAFSVLVFAQAPGPYGTQPGWGMTFEEDFDKKTWQEVVVQLPPIPKRENLVSFYVSAATEHQFMVDPGSISVGQDGVVRYTLVIQASGGAVNTSFEGMRCETREWRHYASGRADGSWSKARNAAWQSLREESRNRHRAALFTDYFCPGGVMTYRADDIRSALKRGGF